MIKRLCIFGVCCLVAADEGCDATLEARVFHVRSRQVAEENTGYSNQQCIKKSSSEVVDVRFVQWVSGSKFLKERIFPKMNQPSLNQPCIIEELPSRTLEWNG